MEHGEVWKERKDRFFLKEWQRQSEREECFGLEFATKSKYFGFVCARDRENMRTRCIIQTRRH